MNWLFDELLFDELTWHLAYECADINNIEIALKSRILISMNRSFPLPLLNKFSILLS